MGYEDFFIIFLGAALTGSASSISFAVSPAKKYSISPAEKVSTQPGYEVVPIRHGLNSGRMRKVKTIGKVLFNTTGVIFTPSPGVISSSAVDMLGHFIGRSNAKEAYWRQPVELQRR
jgi:hypothetical protein